MNVANVIIFYCIQLSADQAVFIILLNHQTKASYNDEDDDVMR